MSDKEPLAYVDGNWYPKSKATVSIYDHGLLYGDGVFESFRVYGGVIFQFNGHLNRLYVSAKAIKLNIPLTPEGMTDAIVETVKRNGLKDAYVRLLVTRGVGDLGVDPRKCLKASVIIIVENVPPSYSTAKQGISLIISSVRRDTVDATSHEIKSLNYLNSVLAKQEAGDHGADDALMLDQNGYLSESTTTNLFIVRDGKVYTPSTSAGILSGVTRNRTLKLIQELGYDVCEKSLTPFDITVADEAFLTGTLAEVAPVVKVKGYQIGNGKPGKITGRIIEAFERIRTDPNEGLAVYPPQKIIA
jgi:branched-chain amino acid aminotransferase